MTQENTLLPNQRDVAATTPGIARDMQTSIKAGGPFEPFGPPVELVPLVDEPELMQGGGNLNGSQNTAHMMGRAGTGADRLASPRRFQANYTGVV